MRMCVSGHQLCGAFAHALGDPATQEGTVVEEELQQSQIVPAELATQGEIVAQTGIQVLHCTTHSVVRTRKLMCENIYFIFDQEMELHLYLGMGFDCPADGVYAHSPIGGIELLKTGVVTEVTFGSEWGLLDHENLVANYISNAVMATKIPMIEWTSQDELAESNMQIRQIMSSLNDFCKARAEPEPITTEYLNRVIACGIDPELNFDRFKSDSNNVLAYTYALLLTRPFIKLFVV